MRIVVFSFFLCLAIVYSFSNVAKVIRKMGVVSDLQLWLMAIGIVGVVTFSIGTW